MKATYCEVNGEPREIFKDPKTVTSTGMTKKSLRGLIRVDLDSVTNCYTAIDGVSKEEEKQGNLIPYFENGEQLFGFTLDNIRARRNSEVNKVTNID